MQGSKVKILVAGGAGFIGSHMALALQSAGYQPIILDNLSTGHRDAALQTPLVIGELDDSLLLEQLFTQHQFVAVMHFASSIEVNESVKNPLKYYRNNVAATLPLLQMMQKHHVKHFIFSSSAAVYGNPTTACMNESHHLQPINPYGRSKLMVETIIQDFAQAHDMHYAILRYFNAAGADPSGRLGERHQPESHLLPLILQAAAGMKNAITIYGNDYPTLDGTCVRDYIHVTDLCQAHLLALQALLSYHENMILNLGTGLGHSVLELIHTAREITGCDIRMIMGERRSGDPAILVADAAAAHSQLNWRPEYSSLETIIKHAWIFMQVSSALRHHDFI